MAAVALVWDPDSSAFYYNQWYFLIEDTGAGEVQLFEQVFSSSDGISWGRISNTGIPVNSTGYRSSYPPSYCRQNDCIDQFGQNVPDGIMGHDPVTKITVKPVAPTVNDYSSGSVDYPTNPSNEIIVADENNLAPVTVAISDIGWTTCAAAAQGVLVAAGTVDAGQSGAIVVSLDRGLTWELLHATPDPVLTVVASFPIQD
jgi:hypothetical protein